MAKKSQDSKEKLTVLPGGKLNNFLNKYSEKVINLKKSRTIYIIAIIAGLLVLGIYKKDWFIAATVNGSPVTNLELQMRLNQQFRSKTLDQLINEKIILSEAAKNNVAVTEEEINKKVSEIETSVGGADTFNALLTQQGQDRNTVKQQIRLQLTIEKLYAKEATVSAEEVKEFIEQNKQSLTPDSTESLSASQSAKLEQEAFNAIRNQKLTQIFSQKFQDLRQKAKIQTF